MLGTKPKNRCWVATVVGLDTEDSELVEVVR
jgi:hypothetical protein